ncbi:MAG: CPBP family intramembrane metalloprotease [Oscillospiraceae bacterium]|jgi:membrane protease YdiL (CAAX protease family)|nr:CPBP family intramembrane metalloprotease [Oscillospiraceae bacterium]
MIYGYFYSHLLGDEIHDKLEFEASERMDCLVNTIRKHKLIFFYIFTFLLTGIFFFVPALLFPNVSFPFFQLPPAIVTFAMIAVLNKTDGSKSFCKGLFPVGFHWKWVVASALLPFTIVLTATIAESVLHGQGFNSVQLLTPGAILAMAAGVIGEEIGFRGYMLPLLLKQHNSLMAGIISGTLWALWHAAYYGEGLGFLLFAVGTIALAIIMTWLYHKSNGNIISAILFHFTMNFCATIIPESEMSSLERRAIYAVVSVTLAVILIFVSSVFRSKKDSA